MALEKLFAPLRIGPTEIPCRIVSTAHQTTLVHDHLPTDEFVAYHEARARGGAGLIILEAVAVAPSGLLTSHTLGGYLPETVGGYRRVARAVQKHGTRLFVQLFHGGREVIASTPRPVAVSASAIPSLRFHTEPGVLTTAEVRALIASYARCAALAAEAGLDGMELSAAHGYLLEQFFNPAYNRRDDEYREPTRALLEVIAAVRDAAPGLALGVRLSGDSPAAREIVKHLSDVIDYVHVTTGNSSTFDGAVGIVPPPPLPRNVVEPLTADFRVGPPVIATARVVTAEDANEMISRGAADAVGMTRALITDPDLPAKTRAGRGSEVLRCIGCNACIAHYHAETPLRCAQNPRTGRELTLARATRSVASRRVVVVGGGPAGLAAAAEAGARGHHVVLIERDQLGGQIWLAGNSPTHQELAATMLANYDQLLRAGSVSVELGLEADADVIERYAPDEVIVASGARPFEPPFSLSGVELVQVWDVLAGRPTDGHILIADWGGDAAGLDCASKLVAEGREVTLAVSAVVPGETLHQYTRNTYIARLLRAGVQIENWLELQGAADGRVDFRNIFAPDLQTSIRCDVLALSLGRVPNQGLEAELRARGLAVRSAGDCRSPRGLEEAILEGTLAAASLSQGRSPQAVG
jgi:2,4-dienoyl-CoA reductase-like NADH-dependent reductase (Old Yellow Enzyme family)